MTSMFKLLLMFLAYVIITALPLLTLKIYNPDVSFLIMVSTEFSLAIIAYFFISGIIQDLAYVYAHLKTYYIFLCFMLLLLSPYNSLLSL